MTATCTIVTMGAADPRWARDAAETLTLAQARCLLAVLGEERAGRHGVRADRSVKRARPSDHDLRALEKRGWACSRMLGRWRCWWLTIAGRMVAEAAEDQANAWWTARAKEGT